MKHSVDSTTAYARTALSALVWAGATLGFAAQATAAAGGTLRQATAPYNEAITVIDGKTVVRTPPIPKRVRDSIPTRPRPGAPGHNGPRIAIETPAGLMDCSIYGFDPRVCVQSNYGAEKLPREWVVLRRGQWQACAGRERPTKCKATDAFAFLPTVVE